MEPARLSYVSVVFEAEFELLMLQARSMARYLEPAATAAIIVIDNSAQGMPQTLRRRLLGPDGAYGAFAEKVTILRPDEIARIPGAVGWQSQQVLKLLVADRVPTERYVVLDSKNHFVATPAADYFVGPDGRMRVNAYSYEGHPLRPNLELVLRYLDVDPAPRVAHFTATVTPFPLDVGLVKRLIADIEQRSGRPFAREFIARDLTEFFLYAGWLESSGEGIETHYELSSTANPAVWPKAANGPGVTAEIARVAERGTPIFSVHRRALGLLDDQAASILAAFWATAGLFESDAAARSFIDEFRSEYAEQVRLQKRRDLPGRILRAPRAVRRRIERRLRRN